MSAKVYFNKESKMQADLAANNSVSSSLILDGPAESILKKSGSYREINLTDFKEDFRKNFISHAASIRISSLEIATKIQ